MKRFIRSAALAAGVLALVAGSTPPAHATTIASVTFLATAQVHGGIGWPIVTLPVGPLLKIDCLVLPGDPIGPTNCHPVYANLRTITITSTVCVDAVVNFNKPGAQAVSAGVCTITAAGTISGHCGISGGQVSGTYTDSTGATSSFSVHFAEAGAWVISGHADRGGTPGKVKGGAIAVPVVASGGQSCANKTQVDLTLLGELTFLIPTS